MLKLARSGWVLQAAGLGGAPLAAVAAAHAGTPSALGALSTRLLSSAGSSSSGTTTQESSSGKKESHDEEWTEVIDKATGQTYYWNQRTGETTSLGDERPEPGSSRYEDARPTEGATSVRYQEPVEKDQTFKYTVMGVFIGVFTGWVSQFI